MSAVSALVALDAHVHLHDPATALAELDRGAENFAEACPEADQAVMMLAERQGFAIFDRLRPSLIATGEAGALWRRPDRRLLIAAGRQVVTREGLEILGLATTAYVPDGLTADATIERLDAADALIVLPWGVGKWLGARGRIVDRLAGGEGRTPFLGDNGGRPGFWPVPRFSGSRLLSGSDPLPLPGSVERIGRFGSLVRGTLPADRPLEALKRLLRDPAIRIEPYGAPASAPRFAVDQVRLRLPGGKRRAA